MGIIREDVVSIGFEVENNPFGELTAGLNDIKARLGILNGAENGLKDIARESQAAGKEVEGLTDKLGTPPASDGLERPLKDTQKETKKAEATLTSLVKSMADAGRVKLDSGMKSFAEGIKKPEIAMKKLAGNAKNLGSHVKKVGIPNALNAGLGKAAMGAGNLLGKLKDTAAIGFKKTIGGLKSMASEAGKTARALGKGTLGAAGGLAKGVVVGVAAAGTALGLGAVAAFQFGSAYETSLAKVSTMVDTSVISVKELSDEVMSLSNKTGEGAAGLNEAVYQALSAGADSGQVVDLVGVAVKAARGGFTDTTTAVDGLTSTLNAFGMETREAEGLANSFLITQNKGKTTFGELASSIGGVAPTASAAGVGVNELLAGVASLTANGIGTSEAMTGIKAAMSNIIKPSAEASKVAQSLGLDFSTAALQSKGLAGFLGDVKTATGGNMDTMAQLFGSVEALNTVLTLTSDNGMALMQDTMNEMATNTTALDTAYETMSDTAQVSVEKGLNSFKNLGIGIYQQNEGIVSEMTGLFSSAGSELYEAFTAGGFDGLVGQIGSTLSTILTTVVGYFPDLVEGGVSIINSLVEGIMQNEEKITDSLVSGMTSLTRGVLKILPKIITTGGKLLTSLVQGIAQNMPLIIPAALEAIQTLADGLIQNVPILIQSAISILNSLIEGLLQSAPLIVNAGIQLIIGLVEGLLNSIDLIINGAINLILALTTGLLNNIPLLVDASITLVMGLVNGLISNIDLLINGAIALIQGLLTGILDNLPVMVEGAVQLMIAFTVGLIQAIPLLIEAVPQLVMAIVDTIMNTDWLKLGGDIVKAIGNGLFGGIQGLFGKGKDAGKELGDGAAAGVTDGTSQLASAADTTAALAVDNLKPDAALLNEYGKQMPDAVANGIQSGAGTLESAAGTLGTNTSNAMLTSLEGMEHTAPIGQNAALNLAGGISSNKDLVISEAAALGQEVTKAATPSVNVSSDMVGAESLKAETQAMVEDSRATLEQLVPVFQQAYHGAAMTVAKEMASIRRGMKTTLDAALADTQGFKTELTSLLSGINLYQTGVNIMSGLNRGMISMRSVLMGTAASTGKSISDSLNGSLDIHSPSRVTEETGEYTGLGLVKGIRNTAGEIKAAARDAGDVTARNIAPYKSRYTPESSAASNTRNTSQTNTYSPVFNLALNGASASDSNERKVKRWIKEAWKENMDSMGRRNPKLQEV